MSASTSSSSSKQVILKSCDAETFEVAEIVASESLTIKNMLEDIPDESTIPLPNITGKILSKVIEFSKKHTEIGDPTSDEKKAELKAFHDEFLKVDQNTLFDLILAANYLNYKVLLDVTCQSVADLIKSMSVEEVRRVFNIENDFTPEEEEKVRQENAWAFE